VKIVPELIKNFLKEEDGLGTVEIVVIIAVLVGIALIFRDAIIKFVTGIMSNVFGDDSIIRDINSSNIRQQNQVN
jgi:Flp pilus assembly pilin Flp